MSKHRILAGEFNHYPARARRLADDHDVVIVSRGRPTTVLMSFARYQRLTGSGRTLLEAIADPDVADIDLEIPRFDEPATPADS